MTTRKPMPPTPQEAEASARAQAILDDTAAGARGPLHPDARRRLETIARWASLSTPHRARACRTMNRAIHAGVEEAARGVHATLGPLDPQWTPSDEQRAYRERIAASPHSPGQARAACLLDAARRAVAEMERAEGQAYSARAYMLLRALRLGKASLQEVVLRAATQDLAQDYARDGGIAPLPLRQEVEAAARATTDPLRLRRAAALLDIIDGEGIEDAAAARGLTKTAVRNVVAAARHKSAAHAVMVGRDRDHTARNTGRAAAHQDATRRVHAQLAAKLGRLPTAQEVAAATNKAPNSARSQCARLGLPLAYGGKGPRPKE